MTDALPTIYTSLDQSENAVAARDAATVLLESADQFITIDNPPALERAGEFRARLNEHIKELEKERLNMTAGARKTTEMINSAFKAITDPLKEKLGLVDRGLKAWFAKLAEQKRQEEWERKEQERLEKEEAEQAETDRLARIKETGLDEPAPPATLQVSAPVEEAETKVQGSHGSTAGMRDNWKYRVTDIKLVPEAYLLPADERVQKSVLNAIARAQKDKANIPGIMVYNDPIISSRVG